MPNDDAWYLMNEMGNMGTIHFMDLNKAEQPFHLPYAGQIKRADEALRRIS